MEYYSVIKRKKIQSVAMMWMNLNPVIQSKVREKPIQYINAHIRNLEKRYW